MVGRFRLSGDVRVRQEDFFQDYTGCATCVPRIRERIRLRLGIEGKLNEDFTAGMFLASGTLVDPTSTNETLTSAFERKTVGFDRGYIAYQPLAHKWLQLTGGKFAPTWLRTNQTFDPDLNPEGFSEKFSFDVKNAYLNNVTLTGMQLLFNEVSAPTTRPNSSSLNAGSPDCGNGGNVTGADAFAVGAQLSTKWKLGRLTTTPSYMVLNWRNEGSLLNQGPLVTGATTTQTVGGRGVVLPLLNAAFAPNGLTNATVPVGTTANGAPILDFRSKYLYGDLILDSIVDTGYTRWPVRVVLEYLNNMRAAKVSPTRGRQSHLYKVETAVGQLKNRKDIQLGYGFWRQEQDSVLAAFNDSDQRAPTNIVQHWVNAQYLVHNNVTLAYTLWYGRTLDRNLPNARLAPGLPAGMQDPYLKRMQFDAVYKF